MSVKSLAILGIGGRDGALSEYFLGVSAMNILARCIKKAQKVRKIDNESLHHPEMAKYIQNTIGLAKQGDDLVDRLARMSLDAAAASGRPINESVKKGLRAGRSEIACYICGGICTHKAEDCKQGIEYEHLWPSSYGGESVIDNLLPACWTCNRNKEAMLLWHTGHIFSFVLKPEPSTEELKLINRREKIAKHIKTIFEYACQERCSLKEGALSVGSVDMNSIYPIDISDSVDFFNFRFA